MVDLKLHMKVMSKKLRSLRYLIRVHAKFKGNGVVLLADGRPSNVVWVSVWGRRLFRSRQCGFVVVKAAVFEQCQSWELAGKELRARGPGQTVTAGARCSLSARSAISSVHRTPRHVSGSMCRNPGDGSWRRLRLDGLYGDLVDS